MVPAATVIANPAAGRRTSTRQDAIARILAPLGHVEWVEPASAEATTAAARECEVRGVPLIVVAGGDGTLHRVVNGLRGSATRVGLIPVGAGNDLARALGLPASPDDAARVVVEGATRDLDVVRVNGTRVVTVAVFGAIADAAHLANRLRGRLPALGALAYKIAAARLIVARGGDPLAGVFVANTDRLGGNMRLPSGSAPGDGVCEVATLAGGRRTRLAQTLLLLAGGRPLPAGRLTWQPLRETRLEFSVEVSASGDGEDLGSGQVFEVVVEPAAVRMIVPAAPGTPPGTGRSWSPASVNDAAGR